LLPDPAGSLRTAWDTAQSIARTIAPVNELRVTMPISIRTATDPLAGNRITLMRFLVPMSETDPGASPAADRHARQSGTNGRSLPFTDAIAAGLGLLPTGFVGGMLKRVDGRRDGHAGDELPGGRGGHRPRRAPPSAPPPRSPPPRVRGSWS
jgi:hypothetical protein